jgi:dihydrofolate synthase / folylpolyglutamate synthase
MSGKTLEDWLSYIEGQHPNNIELGLDRCSLVLERLNIDRPKYKVFTVAGTNGKGSTCAMLTGYFVNDGLSVGTFTSPHFLKFNERIAINGQPVTDASICEAFVVIDKIRGDIELTYFEFNTLAAFYLFSQAKLDYWVLEVGLGGRLDSVNMLDADVAIVTSIALDHTDWLGDSLDQIAIEKTGIARDNCLLVSGVVSPPATIRSNASSIGAILKQKNEDFSFDEQEECWSWKNEEVEFSQLNIPKLPLENAATVIAALVYSELKPTQEKLNKLFSSINLLGRFQHVSTDPHVIIDVAHNPEAASELARQIHKLNVQPIAVCGMLEDKDFQSVIEILADSFSKWFFADLHVPRGAKASTLAQYLPSSSCSESVSAAFIEAKKYALENDLPIVVFGSFHTVADYLDVNS